MKMTGAEITIRLLERQGIDTVSGIPGGTNLPVYDALARSTTIRHILARHEQGAGFIAQGMARSTGKPAVCFATSGPGATNLITAIADAKMDSVPVIAITGQVSKSMIGTDAFQEVDTYGLTIPITKHNYLVRSARELLSVIPEAFRIASSGRPGPVLIDIPKDVQQESIEFDNFPEAASPEPPMECDNQSIADMTEMIRKSKRPLIYAGGGIIQAGASDLLTEFARKNSIPAALTLMGLGAFPTEDPLYLGMIGMHGRKATNKLFAEADLIMAFGVRFDDRATGNIRKFCPQAKIIHCDNDHSEIDKNKKSDLSITGDIGRILEKALAAIDRNNRREWIARLNELRALHPDEQINTSPFHPANLLRTIAGLAGPEAIVTTDVGQHQMWSAQSYPVNKPRAFLTSGGLGTMGFGLPAAIGASLANPGKKVICISGDGSILMNIQELATLADWKLNIKVILFNNHHLGLVRQQQELFYSRNYIACKFQTNPDFVKIAGGFGIPARDIRNPDEIEQAIQEALSADGPVFLNIPIPEAENVLPMVPPGAGNDEMLG